MTHRRYTYNSEVELQDGIETVLRAAGLNYRREVRLSAKDRPDFMVGSIAVEVKINGPALDALRQIHRYSQSDYVGGIVLVTSRASLIAKMPGVLNGKPVVVASLLEGVF